MRDTTGSAGDRQPGLLRYDEEHLAARVRGLTPWARAVFSASCAERVLSRVVALGPARPAPVLAEAVAWLWDELLRGGGGHGEVGLWLDRCMGTLVPDDDARYVPELEFAGEAVAYALRALDRDDPQEAVWAGRVAYESIYYLIERRLCAPNGRLRAEEAQRHPWMRRELACQDADLNDLTSPSGGEASARLRALRERAASAGREAGT